MCDTNPCPQNHFCTDDDKGDHVCDDDPCDPNPCQNNGNCTDLQDGKGGYSCECGGFDGRNCENGKL